MRHAAKERFTAQGIGMEAQKIKATDEWINELSRMPFLSCKYILNKAIICISYIEKRGKTLHLLKASSKKINAHKKRKKIPILGSIKEYMDA